VPSKTARKAVKAYIDPLQKSVAIVCEGVLRANNYDQLQTTSIVTLPEAARLNGRPDLYLSFEQQYRIIEDPKNGPYRVTTRYYSYAIETQDAEEVVGYHWHPDGQSPVRFPHLHLGRAAQIGMPEINRKAHFPTGRVAFEDIVELLVGTFGVRPRRNPWQAVIAATRAAFARQKSW